MEVFDVDVFEVFQCFHFRSFEMATFDFILSNPSLTDCCHPNSDYARPLKRRINIISTGQRGNAPKFANKLLKPKKIIFSEPCPVKCFKCLNREKRNVFLKTFSISWPKVAYFDTIGQEFFPMSSQFNALEKIINVKKSRPAPVPQNVSYVRDFQLEGQRRAIFPQMMTIFVC